MCVQCTCPVLLSFVSLFAHVSFVLFQMIFEISNDNYGCFVEIHALFSWASVLFGVSFSDLVG